MVKRLMGAIAPLLFLLGCTNQQASTVVSPVVYEADLFGTFDGYGFKGVGVGIPATSHDIKINSPTDVNVMTIQTCHRFEHYEDVIKTGWFQPNRGFEYIYNEAPGIEDNGTCILRLGAFSKEVGAGEAYGILIFHNSKYNLPAENICNGVDGGANGTSICQTQSGLLERIKFSSEVTVARPKTDGTGLDGQCQGKFIDPTTFEYIMPLGECVIEFMEKNMPYRKYIHLARGFNKTQYRGN